MCLEGCRRGGGDLSRRSDAFAVECGAGAEFREDLEFICCFLGEEDKQSVQNKRAKF